MAKAACSILPIAVHWWTLGRLFPHKSVRSITNAAAPAWIMNCPNETSRPRWPRIQWFTLSACLYFAWPGIGCDAFMNSNQQYPPGFSTTFRSNGSGGIVPIFQSTVTNMPSDLSVLSSGGSVSIQDKRPIRARQQEASISTMRHALMAFFAGSFHGPGAVLMSLVGLVAWRLQLASAACLGVEDIAIISASVLYWWFQEHWMHKYLLHCDFDWYGKRIHEEHHRKPYHHVSIDPAPLMLGWMAAVHVVLRALLPLPLAISATIGYAAAGLIYEWSHFIVHTKVRFPRHSYWQRMKDHHIRHHLVDDSNWFAFSCIQVDDIFGTNPNVDEVKQLKKLAGRRSSS
jgi:Fatty acid hydroxylase superfamily